MKYILMMNGKRSDFEGYAKWSKEDLRANVAFMRTFSKELKDSGVFVSTEGLGWPSEAKLVRAGKNGEPITDGVFPESKEFLAGYWIIDVESPEQVRKSLPTSRFGITDPRQNRSASSKAASSSLFHCS
jgi:hypothetical protein